ncbi:MAG: relaxase/mobilization nuclease domain-containing protein [Lachnospiraceae bacterium]|nr:relaxase/mobilization nuclease domain-containing protein [Lachnospiraceae bacterium]
MATTRIIPMHINKGKSIAQCLKERTEYAMNREKTNGGEYISSYACDPATVDHEFLLARNAYLANTGRHYDHEVIAYQIRQSFKPGEVTPEEANHCGYELAMRLLKGNHAFIVATHNNTGVVHNHIIFAATDLSCTRKFRNFFNSYKAVATLSDQISEEHRLSVIADPKRYSSQSYNKWLGDKAKPSGRDMLRVAIDDALNTNPDGFDALMKWLEETGWTIKRGKQLSFLAPDGKRYMRLDTLGPEYSEEALREVLAGKRTHIPYRWAKRKGIKLVIDVEEKLKSGKGRGFETWAKDFNLKMLAKSVAYIREHNIETYDDLSRLTADAESHQEEIHDRIRQAEVRLKVIGEQKKASIDYKRTKAIYAQYRESGWSSRFYAEHEQDILIHKAAKKVFDSYPDKFPSIAELNTEERQLILQRQKDYAEYKEAKASARELATVKANIHSVLRDDDQRTDKTRTTQTR